MAGTITADAMVIFMASLAPVARTKTFNGYVG
jgi:hypothetical protein